MSDQTSFLSGPNLSLAWQIYRQKLFADLHYSNMHVRAINKVL